MMNHINPIITVSILLFLLTFQQSKKNYDVEKIYAQVWGKEGENWDTSRIPDFTQVGYKSGTIAIPDFPVGVSVTDFGAVGDGITDNTKAFREAIAACGEYQTVFIPSGTYLLKDTLRIGKGNISLSSDKKMPATLYFDKGIEELYPLYNIKGAKKTKWSWSGAMLLFSGKISNVGISNLKIKFPDNIWQAHDFHERGYNGIGFGNSVHDGWVKNTTITGADLGIWIDWKAHHITVENWVLDFGPARGARKYNGHHGVNIYGGYNLIQNFRIKGQFSHDLSLESRHAIYNVFRNGTGNNINIDHHNHGQSKNLFTNLNVGTGTRLYQSGGQKKPRGICTYETFWNITGTTDMSYPDEKDNATLHSKGNVCVGIRTRRPSVLGDAYGNWFETIEPAALYPQDLYQAQKEYKRLK